MNKIFLIFFLLIFCGCSSIPKVSPGHEKLGKLRRTKVTEFVEAKFGVDGMSVHLVDSKNIVVGGRIVNPTLVFRTTTKEEEFRALGAWGANNKWSPTGRRFPSYEEKKRWALSKVDLQWGYDFVRPSLGLDSNGFFRTTVDAGEGYYFIRPDRKRYYKLFSKMKDLGIGAGHYAYGKRQRAFVNFDPVKVYFFKEDVDAVRGFGASLARRLFNTASVTIEFREQTTHREVAPRVVVTPVGVPTRDEFVDSFRPLVEREFGGNDKFVKLGMGGVLSVVTWDALWGGNVAEDKAQSISFNGIVGQKYKIETVHGGYYYFKGFLVVESSALVNKSVLLVEKGGKVRVQSVKEGEGGVMINQ